MAKCGACGGSFGGDTYQEHACEVTGYTPAQIEHQDALTGGRASRIADAALARGAARALEE